MKSYRYQLLVMSVMAILWSLFELGIRVYSYFTLSDSVNKSEWLAYAAQNSILFAIVILTGVTGIAAMKKVKLWPLAMIMGIVSLLTNVALFFVAEVQFNIVIIVAAFMITYNAFQLRKSE